MKIHTLTCFHFVLIMVWALARLRFFWGVAPLNPTWLAKCSVCAWMSPLAGRTPLLLKMLIDSLKSAVCLRSKVTQRFRKYVKSCTCDRKSVKDKNKMLNCFLNIGTAERAGKKTSSGCCSVLPSYTKVQITTTKNTINLVEESNYSWPRLDLEGTLMLPSYPTSVTSSHYLRCYCSSEKRSHIPGVQTMPN